MELFINSSRKRLYDSRNVRLSTFASRILYEIMSRSRYRRWNRPRCVDCLVPKLEFVFTTATTDIHKHAGLFGRGPELRHAPHGLQRWRGPLCSAHRRNSIWPRWCPSRIPRQRWTRCQRSPRVQMVGNLEMDHRTSSDGPLARAVHNPTFEAEDGSREPLPWTSTVT